MFSVLINAFVPQPIMYQDNHRLNVEVKKTKRIPLMMGGSGGDMRLGGMNDGRMSGGRGSLGNRMTRGGRMGGINMMGSNRGRGFANARR